MQGLAAHLRLAVLAGTDARQRQRVLDDTVALLAPTQRDAHGQWSADYVRLRFEARLRTS